MGPSSWIQQEFRPANWNKGWYLDFEDAGGARIPTIQQFLVDPVPYHTQCPWDECHYDWVSTDHAPAEVLRKQYQRLLFNEVQIFKFNQESGDLVTNFICQTLKYAENTCRGLQDGSVEVPPQLNEAIPRFLMDYEYLAQAAHDKYNWVAFTKNRRALVVQVKRHHEVKISKCPPSVLKKNVFCEDLKPFTIVCLTDSEKNLLTSRTISYERELFPDDFAGSGDGGKEYENMLRTNALIQMKSDKYCVIDVEKTLAEPWWDVFFTALSEGKDPYELANQPWDNI